MTTNREGRAIESMREAVESDPDSPAAVIYRAALAGVPCVFVPPRCQKISSMPNGGLALIFGTCEPDAFDVVGLRNLIVAADQVEVWDTIVSGHDTAEFVQRAANSSVVGIMTHDGDLWRSYVTLLRNPATSH